MENRKEKPLISVIVPVYNGRSYLESCIASIEGQTYSPVEILLIDDGSTDGTDRICKALAERNPAIRLFRLADEGVSAARNRGLQEAKGEYVSFVDADDRILPHTLETLYQVMEDTQSDVSGCSFCCWSRQEQWLELQKEKEEQLESKQQGRGVVKTYHALPYLKEEILKGNSRCWSKLYKRSLLADHYFRTNLSIGEDMLFLVDLLPKLTQIAETTYQGYAYYQNPQGVMYRSFEPKYMDQITCWEIARDLSVSKDASLEPRLTAKLMTAIMLTVGKLAVLSSKEREQNQCYVQQCHEKLQEQFRIPNATSYLSKGYKIKVRLFRRFPHLYLYLYHLSKKIY